jgi:hypothetical protein
MTWFVSIHGKEASCGSALYLKGRWYFRTHHGKVDPQSFPIVTQTLILVDVPHFSVLWYFPHFGGRTFEIRFSHVNLILGVVLFSCQFSYKCIPVSTHSRPCPLTFLVNSLIPKSLKKVISLPRFVLDAYVQLFHQIPERLL